MTAISQPTTFDLLRAPKSQFKRWGISAKRIEDYRVRHTGHCSSLSRLWAQSVGYWAGGRSWESPRPLFCFEDPSKAIVPAKEQTYANFKSYWKLYAPNQFQKYIGREPWLLAERSYAAIAAEFKRAGASYSLGEAANAAWGHSVHEYIPTATHLGLLPVEILLWARIFHAFLTSYGLDLVLWQDMPLDDQRSFWKHEVRATPESRRFYSPATFLRRPAILSYEEDDALAGGGLAKAS
jgi:hypothetical protein